MLRLLKCMYSLIYNHVLVLDGAHFIHTHLHYKTRCKQPASAAVALNQSLAVQHLLPSHELHRTS
jgi:hypothetical protein